MTPPRDDGVAPLELLFDAFALSTLSAKSGIGTYQRELLTRMSRRGDVHVTALATSDVRLPPGVTRRRIRRVAPGRFAQWEHDQLLRFSTRRAHADLYHSPSSFPPTRPPRCPWVQTLYDVIPLAVQDPALAKTRRRFEAAIPSYRAADAIVAISRYAAETGIEVLGLDPDKVHVVPLAASDEFSPGPARPRDEAPYVLVVSTYDARKGFPEAFAIAGELADRGYPHQLVMAGALPEWLGPIVESLRAAAPRPDRIELRGFVPDLVDLYRGADVVLVPSRAEGFGLPAVEGMACGIPVVAFANTSLPEVVGDGGLLVPDGDVVAAADAIAKVLDDPALRADLHERGLSRAAQLSWDACVSGHLAVYTSVSR